ncbi:MULTISPECIES: histone-like nucleoid-structuring protein Lsr2 [unclassified Pseudonocardia]|uniref:Lsr2 family DNA-binding protein n=1 Tax=unclassified Pseudonocardia TaxID=2619320 RepID=UPI00094AF566|nr:MULTISPECIES: histone-like nucleoid-structuring protein Lsr2 [unclassified Pseudonocardia]
MSTSTSTGRHQHSNAIRSWARQNGYRIAERGCIPVEIIEAYEKNADSAPAPSPFATSATSAPQFQEAG